MKKLLLVISLIFLTGAGCEARQQNQQPTSKTETSIVDETAQPVVSEKTADENKKIDIKNTKIVCKNADYFFGEDLIKNGYNFSLVGGLIFYKAEELEKICNPDMKKYNPDAEPSFAIIPAYLNDTK